ncbi:hypothetical protein COB21_01015 [Candidatus Aerophobetes bacterium]|uniref:Uncharacterized protein n=1 Tax=Aerophobetes bacterium TaxID=2030807 RepID=A0A2A4X6Z8_UNCAE|nr:MAG: hypothetical protein COB21_01015 [Candidatus Aerophobetes bacterium]
MAVVPKPTFRYQFRYASESLDGGVICRVKVLDKVLVIKMLSIAGDVLFNGEIKTLDLGEGVLLKLNEPWGCRSVVQVLCDKQCIPIECAPPVDQEDITPESCSAALKQALEFTKPREKRHFLLSRAVAAFEQGLFKEGSKLMHEAGKISPNAFMDYTAWIHSLEREEKSPELKNLLERLIQQFKHQKLFESALKCYRIYYPLVDMEFRAQVAQDYQLAFKQNERSKAVFGPGKWQKFFGITIDNSAPQLPIDIEATLARECPYQQHGRLDATHFRVLIPQGITLRMIGQDFVGKEILKTVGDIPVKRAYWMLITRKEVPGSMGKTFFADKFTTYKKLLRGPYRMPTLLEAAITVLFECKLTGGKKSTCYFTWCQEGPQYYVVGRRGREALPYVDQGKYDDEDFGLRGVWQLKAEEGGGGASK